MPTITAWPCTGIIPPGIKIIPQWLNKNLTRQNAETYLTDHIKAVGIRSHLDAERPLDATALTHFIHNLRGLGLQVPVTELDVNDAKISGSFAERDQVVAALYSRYLSIVMPGMTMQRLIF